jgi:homoserine kinase
MTIEPTKFTLRVPSTTANLGPGFDCLGLALGQENSWTVEVTSEDQPGRCRVVECSGESAHTLPKGETHLFFATWKTLTDRGYGPNLFEALRASQMAVKVSAHNGTPLARGLGSSAAVRVASAETYRRLTGADSALAWQMASAIEGHPDNAAPAGLGGLISGLLDGNGVWRALPQEIHPCWQLVVAIPEFSLLTVEARRVLPKKFEKASTLFNLARLPYLIEGLRKGDSELLAWGCDDRLHQPYRAGLIPGFHEVVAAGVKAGAPAVYLSGAGPTMAAFVDRRTGVTEAVRAAMQKAFTDNGVEANALVLEVDHGGLRVLEGSSSVGLVS